jgi:hypothetical protein
VSRLVAVIPAAIVLIVAVSMGIGASLLGYPVWAIPLIAVFGAGGALLRSEYSASEVSNNSFLISSENWLTAVANSFFAGV